MMTAVTLLMTADIIQKEIFPGAAVKDVNGKM
jgi:hypothetical protein